MGKNNAKSLAFSIPLYIALMTVVAVLIATFFEYLKLRNETRHILESKKYVLARTLEGASAEPLSIKNPAKLKILIGRLAQEDYVGNISIYDSNGNLFAAAGTNDEEDKNNELVEGKITHEKDEVGRYLIRFSIAKASRQIWHGVIQSLIVFSLIGLYMVVGLHILIKSMIISKIQRLQFESGILSEGKLEKEFIWHGEDEISELGQNLDIARKNLLEEKVRVTDANSHLEAYSAELEERVTQKSQQVVHSARMASLGIMASGIAHEVNNPLAILQGNILALKKRITRGELTNTDLTATLEKMEKTGQRIANIISGLMQFSDVDESEKVENINFKSWFTRVLNLCNERMSRLGVEMRTEKIEDIPFQCRPKQLTQVLYNLIINAQDAVERLPEKWISVETSTKDGWLTISVTDSGKGIPKAIAANIMIPFFTTKEVGRGPGLGLSVSQEIVEAHGGRLYLDEACQNTRFVVEIPIKSQVLLKSA